MSMEALLADARAVETVERHFEELQSAAAALLSSLSASRRGYFTPAEDEQVRHLLVSYWHSRNALLEVVFGCRRNMKEPGTDRHACFLVGFAGALVLIDAARFLRENIHGRPVVRQKLNEPEPKFGVPEGVYDTVQESLTRPMHIWHMYHAVVYFEERQDELRRAVQTQAFLEPMLAIIDRLRARLHIGLDEYALVRLRVRVRQVWTGVQRDLLFRALYGLQKLAGSLFSHVSLRPGHQPQLPEEIVQALRALLEPGDVLLTRKEFALTNYFLPGYWPHAALYLGSVDELQERGLDGDEQVRMRWTRLVACDTQEPRRVLEAMKDGVLIRSLKSPCGADSLIVLRPRLSASQINKALSRGIFHEGKQYDFDFDFSRSDRLVCTEVVYRAYDGVGGMQLPLVSRAGRLTLSAEDLLQLALRGGPFSLQAMYARQIDNQLLLERSADEGVRAVCQAWSGRDPAPASLADRRERPGVAAE